jgi:hypothetical protein
MSPQVPQRVGIVGAGPVGLCNARTLLDDGFDVTIVTAVRLGPTLTPELSPRTDQSRPGRRCRRGVETHLPRARHQLAMGQFHLLVGDLLQLNMITPNVDGADAMRAMQWSRDAKAPRRREYHPSVDVLRVSRGVLQPVRQAQGDFIVSGPFGAGPGVSHSGHRSNML